jgi:hypothetical protein
MSNAREKEIEIDIERCSETERVLFFSVYLQSLIGQSKLTHIGEFQADGIEVVIESLNCGIA